MKTARIKMVVWMLMGMLIWSLPQVQVHAEVQNGGEVSLPHIHAGNPAEKGGCYTAPVYHSHSGSSSSGGGCYTIRRESSRPCTEGYRSKLDYVCKQCNEGSCQCGAKDYAYYYEVTCPRHGQQRAGYTTNTTSINGNCGGSITDVYYDIGCGKAGTIVSYETGCGYSACGSAHITNQDTAIAKEASLTCEVLSAGAGCHVTGYIWSNGDSAQTTTVTGNGTYTCSITYTDESSGGVGSANVSITVNNIDDQGPTISANQTEGWTKESVLLAATAEDRQAGLPENAYSWDGNEWLPSAEQSVTENGSYTLKVRDRLGNQSEYTFTVSNIDREAPVITTWQLSNEEYTDQPITLTITAVDHGAGLADQPYSLDGEHWQSENAFVIDQSGTYNVYVRDRLGNSTSLADESKSIEITNIDMQAPDISGKQTPEGWTNGAVLLTATAEDGQSGLHENAYSWDGNEWLPSAERSVTENGSYTLTVRDRLGNQSEYTFTVSGIDYGMPVIESWTVSTVAPTRVPVKIVVQAGDYESGLAMQAYSLDGEHWQSENVFLINKNGTYNIYVRDKAGNVTSLADEGKAVVISNIRKTEPDPGNTKTPTPVPTPTPPTQEIDLGLPVVELTLESQGEWPNGKNKILVIAHDTESGLDKEPYSYDGGQTWTDAAEYEITESGIYVVFVRDATGNITESVIEAVKMEVITELGTGEEGITIIPPAGFMPIQQTEEDDLVQEQLSQADMGNEWFTVQDQYAGTEIWQPEEDGEITQIDEPETPKVASYQQSSVDVEKIVAVVAGTAAGGGIFIFFVWCFGTWVPVYAQTAGGRYKRIGRVGLHHKKEIYQICLGRMLLNRAETNRFKVKFGKQFVKKHGSELLRVGSMANEAYTDLTIDEEVTFQI